jgi:hypothetical protein
LTGAAGDLSTELRSLLRPGAEPSAVAMLPLLCSLEVVAARSCDRRAPDIALAARDVLRDGCAALDTPISARATLALLGLAGEWRGQTLAQRRAGAAEVLSTTPESVRKHRETPLLRALAWEILDLDRHYRQMQVVPVPLGESNVSVRWFDLHVVYGWMFTMAWALRSDILGWIEMGAVASDRQRLYEESSLWWYAQLLSEIRDHVRLYGGLLMLADRDAETEIADIVWLWQVLPPFDESGNSWLRTTLNAANDPVHSVCVAPTHSCLRSGAAGFGPATAR